MKAKKIKKIISDVFTTIIILVSFVILTVGMLPKITSYDGYYVTSDSMSPAINKGDIVFVKEVAFEEIEVSDVLTFKREGSEKWFSHRVVKIDKAEKSFKTKGDNNTVEDPIYTSYDEVVGRVEKKFPLIGYVPMFLAKAWGKAILVIIYILYIAFEIEYVASKKRKKG